MRSHQRRLVSFAGTAVTLRYEGARAAGLVDFLYRYVPGAASGPSQVSYDLISQKRGSGKDPKFCPQDTSVVLQRRNRPRDGDGKQSQIISEQAHDKAPEFLLYRDGAEIYRGDCTAAVAELLLGDTCHHLAKHSRGGLLFHAAALAGRGQGLLLPGSVGAGKTTLAAYLAASGLDYLTDEIVFIPHGKTAMQAFTRPLNVKTPSRPVLQDYVDFQASAALILCNTQACLISPEHFGIASMPGETPLKLIVFPAYARNANPALRPLSKARAGMALMQCLVNARNLPRHGFPDITRLARIAPAYEMPYSDLDQVKDRLLALLAQNPFSKEGQV